MSRRDRKKSSSSTRTEKPLIDFGPSPPSSPPLARDPFDAFAPTPATSSSSSPAAPYSTTPLTYTTIPVSAFVPTTPTTTTTPLTSLYAPYASSTSQAPSSYAPSSSAIASPVPSGSGSYAPAFDPAALYGSSAGYPSPMMMTAPAASSLPAMQGSAVYAPPTQQQQQYGYPASAAMASSGMTGSAAPSVSGSLAPPAMQSYSATQALSPLFQQMSLSSMPASAVEAPLATSSSFRSQGSFASSAPAPPPPPPAAPRVAAPPAYPHAMSRLPQTQPMMHMPSLPATPLTSGAYVGPQHGSVRQMAAQIASQMAAPSSASTVSLSQSQRPFSEQELKGLPRSANDEALLPMAVGQAFAWKQWEDRGNTYHQDQELAKRLQAELEEEDERKARGKSRRSHEQTSSSRSKDSKTLSTDEKLARILQEAERMSAGRSSRSSRSSTRSDDVKNDSTIAAMLQAEEDEAAFRGRGRRTRFGHH